MTRQTNKKKHKNNNIMKKKIIPNLLKKNHNVQPNLHKLSTLLISIVTTYHLEKQLYFQDPFNKSMLSYNSKIKS